MAAQPPDPAGDAAASRAAPDRLEESGERSAWGEPSRQDEDAQRLRELLAERPPHHEER